MSTAVSYSLFNVSQYLTMYHLSTVCQYLTLYRLLVLCHYANCCRLQSVHSLSVPDTVMSVHCLSILHIVTSVHCLSVPHSVPSVCSVTPRPLPYSTVCPLFVNTSHCTVCWFCITVSTAVFYSLSTVCQYLTLYRLLVLCHCVHCCLLQSVHCLSVPHTVPSVGSVSLCPLLPSTVCPLPISTPHCTVCWFYVTMSTAAF